MLPTDPRQTGVKWQDLPNRGRALHFRTFLLEEGVGRGVWEGRAPRGPVSNWETAAKLGEHQDGVCTPEGTD